MFRYYADFEEEFCALRDPAFSRALNPELQNFDQWLERNAAHITLR